MDFNPDEYLAKNSLADASKFDPDAYLAKNEAFSQNRENIEPGVMGDTVPTEQKLLNNTTSALSGATLPSAVTGLVKGGMSLLGKGLNNPLTKNIVPAIGDTADDMLLKGLGTRPGQARQLGGIEEAREAAKLGRRAGADDVFSTERGSRAQLKQLIDKEGNTIGGLRKEAGAAPSDYYEALKQDLMQKYDPKLPDVYSAGKPKVDIGLNTIKNKAAEAVPTHANIAKGITDLNKFAVGEKLIQPNTPLAEVAKRAAGANDAGIVQSLGPVKGKQYLDALKTESGAFHLKPFVERGAEREALSRGGHGNIISSVLQKLADSGGYRAASKGLNAVHEGLSAPLPNLAPVAANVPNQQLEEYLKNKLGNPTLGIRG